MDSPIQPRRSIPTKLKPRLRHYLPAKDGYDRYLLTEKENSKLTATQRWVLIGLFGNWLVTAHGYMFCVSHK